MADLVRLALDNGCYLQQIDAADAPTLLAVIEANRSYLRPFLNWIDGVQSLSNIEFFINNCQLQTTQLKGITFLLFQQDEIIGSIALYDWMHDVKCIHIGYWIAAKHSGKGIGTAMAQRLLSYAFADLEMNKVQLYFIPENTASERLADKLGFKIEGFVRQSFFLNGMIKDQYLAGLLRAEYFERLGK